MSSLHEFDRQQLQLIKRKIELFEKKIINLFELKSEASALLNATENLSDQCKGAIQGRVNFLEMIQNCMEEGSVHMWKGDIQYDLAQTIIDLNKLISDLTQTYLTTPDTKIKETATIGDSEWLLCPYCHDAWKSSTQNAMVECLNCERISHNPRSKCSSKD